MPEEAEVQYIVYRSEVSPVDPATAQYWQGPVFNAADPQPDELYWSDFELTEDTDYYYKLHAEAFHPGTGEVLNSVWSNEVSVHIPLTTLIGKVYAPDGTTPLSDAFVQVHTENWSYNGVAFSDDDGSFKLSPPAGDYVLDIHPPEDLGLGQKRLFIRW